MLDIFDTVRLQKDDAPTNEEQDLLRAMLVFASSGLDSMVKHLVRDALPSIINQDTGARESLRKFVQRRLTQDDQSKILSEFLVAENPTDPMVDRLVRDLTDNSMQSVERLRRVASDFNVGEGAVGDLNRLQPAFQTRNQIIHEMDADVHEGSVSGRRQRDRDGMVTATNQVLEAATAFLSAADAKLAGEQG